MRGRVIALAGVLLQGSLMSAQGPSHELWGKLLQTYVTPDARVNYAEWARSGKPELARYVAAIAIKWPETMTPAARKAALINAYNALTVSWILSNYPLESIWRTKQPFTLARHAVDGRKVSLDDIETTLRDMGDPRIHAALVCASRGCPPLGREAFVESRLEEQLGDRTRNWLANPDYNKFLPHENAVKISKIFDWYRGDFEKNGGSVKLFLTKHSSAAASFVNARTAIRYKTYHWGLNDVSKLGQSYSQLKFLWDAARNK